MVRYLAYRIGSAICVVILVSLLSFFLIKLIPGDPAAVIAGPGASLQDVQRIRQVLGTDQPLWVQFLSWDRGLLHGNLGTSFALSKPVTSAIAERLPVTLALALFAFTLTVLFGIVSGILAALNKNTLIDHATMLLALVGLSVPNFWLGLMLIFLFAVELGWLPSGGYVPLLQDPAGWIASITLPAISLALMNIGLLARMTRSSMLEVLGQDFIRTARAKGVPAGRVVTRHALRSALIPMVTTLGIMFSLLLGGSVVIETVYSLPGFGALLASAILSRDYPTIQGGLLLVAVVMVLVNLAVDLLYMFIDPRIGP
jgi:peptide/nickel transport system permease protein